MVLRCRGGEEELEESSDEDLNFSRSHDDRGAKLRSIRGKTLPEHMAQLPWLTHMSFSHMGGRTLANAAKYTLTHVGYPAKEGGRQLSASEMLEGF